jgi:hypothetical protein
MALDDLLSRLEEGESITPVTLGQCVGVTPKPSPLLAVTDVTPVTRQMVNMQDPTRPETAIPLTAEYFDRHGIEPLSEDMDFLSWHLPRNARMQREAIGQYIAIWRKAMEKEPKSQCKQNTGRRVANTWLRLKQDNDREDS